HPPPHGRQRVEQDLDVDVPLLARQPGRAEARHDQQRVLGEGEEVRRALVTEVPEDDVERDDHHHRRHQEGGDDGHAVDDGVVPLGQQAQGAYFGSGPGVKSWTTFSKFSMPPAFSMRSFMRCRLAARAPSLKRLMASGDWLTVLMPSLASSACSCFPSTCRSRRLEVSWA